MANTHLQNGADEDRPAQLQSTVDGARQPKAILLFPSDAMPPDGWDMAWAQAGWVVADCGSAEEIHEALARPVATVLTASPWSDTGGASSGDAIVRGLQRVIHALGIAIAIAPTVSSVGGGMARRSDFLSHLSVVVAAPERGCCVLMAIRVDKLSELVSRLPMTALFELEEQICARFAAVLHEEDVFTIWLELGFGVLVQRENSDQVRELAEEICACVAKEPFLIADQPTPLTVSIGVALWPRGNAADGAHRWFATAHAAQAIANRHGGNRQDGVLSREYDPIPAERVLIIREWLEEAKSGGNVMIEFQPVLPLSDTAADLYSVHAKLRDHRAPLGGVYRREYLRLAREAGAMVMIDRLSLFGAFEALEQAHALGRSTCLLVPVEFASLVGVPWRWLQAELDRRRHLVGRLILELEANQELEAPENLERISQLRELGVRIGLSDHSGDLQKVAAWSRLPADVLRLQLAVVDAVLPTIFSEQLACWREQDRQLIVDGVEEAGAIARFNALGVDYARGQGLAAIGPRLDFEFG